jgi:muconate cycloisomerase
MTAMAIKEVFLPAISGQNVTEIEQLHVRMNRVLRGYPYAKAAIDVALHDAIGKIYGVPVYQLLGGKVREGTELAHSIGLMDAETAAREAAEVVAEGITTIKVKIGVEAERDIQVVSAVRQAIGSAGKIRVDANQGYRTWREAVRVINAMEKYDLVYAEQPVEGLRAMAEVSARINVPVMADESAWNAQDVLEIVRLNAAQMLSVYYTKPGGLAPSKRLLAVAGAAGLPCDINGSAEMGIGVAADLHLAVSSPEIMLPGTIPVTSTAEHEVTKVAGRKYLDDLIKTPFRFDKGKVYLTDAPGLGIEVDEAKIAKYRIG